MPWAGGTEDAEKMPSTPQRISKVMPEVEKPAPRQKMEKRNMEAMNMVLRPKRSATLPKKRRRDPAVSLWFSVCVNRDVVLVICLRCRCIHPCDFRIRHIKISGGEGTHDCDRPG